MTCVVGRLQRNTSQCYRTLCYGRLTSERLWETYTRRVLSNEVECKAIPEIDTFDWCASVIFNKKLTYHIDMTRRVYVSAISSDVISNARTSQIYFETIANATVVFLHIYIYSFLELTQRARTTVQFPRRCKEGKKSAPCVCVCVRARDGKIDST